MVIYHDGKKRKMGIQSNTGDGHGGDMVLARGKHSMYGHRVSPKKNDYANTRSASEGMGKGYYGDGEGHPAEMPQHVKVHMAPDLMVGPSKDYPDTAEALHGEQARVAHQLHRYQAKERY
jgi:hypothetical protein